MANLVLEGRTLGQRHRHYNSLMKAAVEDPTRSLEGEEADAGDAAGLLRVDVACARRDVPAVLRALRSPDLLLAARAVRRSVWLVADPQYAHIVNPDYLERELFPSMTEKAKTKLISAIKKNLVDEARIDEFFNYYKDDPRSAMKWLHSCSNLVVKFVQENAFLFSVKQIVRLCRKSITILEAYCKQYQAIHSKEVLENSTNLLYFQCNQYLDIVDFVGYYYKPKFSKKATQIILDRCRERVIDRFDDYCDILHIPTIALSLKSGNIKYFLLKLKQNKYLYEHWFKFENLKHFFKYIPNNDRLPIIYSLFLNENIASTKLETDRDYSKHCLETTPVDDTFCLGKSLVSRTDEYRWYSFVPFSLAITELKTIIRFESSPVERLKMFKVLLVSTWSSQPDLRILLKFYQTWHINEALKYKMRFINTFISNVKTYEFDDETWNILNNLFLSLEVYSECDNKVNLCIIAIIVYKVLHDQCIPEIIEKKFKFNTQMVYRNKLNKSQQTKIFNYLHDRLMIQMKQQIRKMTNENEMIVVVETLCKMLNLLADWKKNLDDYPLVISKIKDIINVKRQKSWKFDLTKLYKAVKPWRQLLFEESLFLHPSQEACLNALKHDPNLLLRYSTDVEFVFLTGNPVERLLRKIRVYWTESMCQHYVDFFFKRIKQPKSQCYVKHMFILVPRRLILPFIEEHAPKEPSELIDGNARRFVRKYIAKFMHLVRPSVNLDTVLMYARGVHLHVSMPSLNSVLYNMSSFDMSKYLTQLLGAPVSLQKHGIRSILRKLKIGDIKENIVDIWITTNHLSTKMVIMRQTFELLSKAKNHDAIKDLCELFALYVDSMMSEENIILLNILAQLKKVPISVRPLFFKIGYLYLKSLTATKSNLNKIIELYLEEATALMDVLEPGFVEDELLESLEDNYLTENSNLKNDYKILTSYLLSCKSDEIQMRRYEKLLLPILQKALRSWNKCHKCIKTVKVKLREFFLDFIRNLTYRTTSNGNIVPNKLFKAIQSELTTTLVDEYNYDILLTWNIATIFVNILDIYVKGNPQIYVEEEEELIKETATWVCSNIMPFGFIKDNNKLWKNICHEIAEPFGRACANYLKQDIMINNYPSLYICVKDILRNNILLSLDFDHRSTIKFLTAMLTDNIYASIYCLVISYLPHLNFYDQKPLERELLKVLRSNTSIDVKIHLSHYDDTHIRMYDESDDDDTYSY